MADKVKFLTGLETSKDKAAKVKGQILFSTDSNNLAHIYYDKDSSTRLPVVSDKDGKGNVISSKYISSIEKTGNGFEYKNGEGVSTYVDSIVSKTYTDVIASNNNQADGNLYFMTLRPTAYTGAIWYVKYRVYVSIPNQVNAVGYFLVERWGTGGAAGSIKIFNNHNSENYRTIYYHTCYPLTSAGYDAGLGIALGVALRSSYNPTNSTYARIIKVDVLETTNCTITMLDTPTKFADLPNGTTTYYRSLQESNAANNGLQETGDNDDIYLVNTVPAMYASGTVYNLHLVLTPDNATCYDIVLSNTTNTTKSCTTAGFKPENIYLYDGSKVSDTNTNTYKLYRIHKGFEARYSFNCGSTLTVSKPVYLIATYNTTDGLFYLKTDGWYTQDLPTSEDGYYYIYIGKAYATTAMNLEGEHPVYYYKNGKVMTFSEYSDTARRLATSNVGSGSLPIYIYSNGEPRAVDAKSTANNLIKSLDGLNDLLSGSEYFISSNSAADTTFYRRPLSRLWDYINTKASTLYLGRTAAAASAKKLTYGQALKSTGAVKSSVYFDGSGTENYNSYIEPYSMAYGKMLYTDPYFLNGNNGLVVYNNAGNKNVSITRKEKESDNPFAIATHQLEIKNIGQANPDAGGVVANTYSRPNAVFIVRFVAKVPEGRYLQYANNNLGTGYSVVWLTDRVGTGKFEEYMYKVKCGTTGTFSSFGHLYIQGAVGTADDPLVWQLAYHTIYDVMADTTLDWSKIDNKPAFTTDVNRDANTILAAPNGSSGKATFRKLVKADIPTLDYLPLSGGTLTGPITFNSSLVVNNGDAYSGIRFIRKNNVISNYLYTHRNDTGVGGIFFRTYSWSDGTTTTGYYEDYVLPNTPTGLTKNGSYSILTSKNPVSVAQGGTGTNNATDARTNLAAGHALTYENSFYGLTHNNGSTSDWIRTTANGLIPYSQDTTNGKSSIGTSSWPFAAMYAKNFYGNATSATKLATARTIGLDKAVSATATAFDGSGNITIPVNGVSEAYLTWGGRNLKTSYGPIDAAMISALSANRFAGMPADAITVEYSSDNGATWTNYETTDGNKRSVLTTMGALYLRGPNSTVPPTDLTTYQLRITLDGVAGGVYTNLNKFAVYIGTNGSVDCKLKIERAIYSNPTNFITQVEDVPIGGWDYWNIINQYLGGSGAFGGTNNSDHNRYLRFTFTTDGATTNTTSTGLVIYSLYAYGGVGWATPSSLAAQGTPYTYDYDSNVIFPKKVSATSLEITGANTFLYSGIDRATANATRYPWFSGSKLGNPVYSTNFQYNPGTNVLTVGTVNAKVSADNITGVIDTSHLPAAALPVIKTVANQAARYALTSTDVQVGDSVYQTDTNQFYMVIDVSKLGNEGGYRNYVAGTSWYAISDKPSTATSDKDGLMSSADKVKLDAVENNYLKLSGGTMTGQIQRAGQGSTWINGRNAAAFRVNSLIGYSPALSIKTKYGSWEIGAYEYSGFYDKMIFNYASDANLNSGSNVSNYFTLSKEGLFSGTAASANKLNTNAGSASQPVYFSNGIPVAITTLGANYGGTGKTTLKDSMNALVNSLEVGTSEPADDDYYISQWANGGTSNTAFLRRKISTLYTYIKGRTDSVYLPLKGGTLTGKLTLPANLYLDSYTSSALELSNSNISGVNGIYFNDLGENQNEGLNFYRDSTHADSLRAYNGEILFVPNRTLTGVDNAKGATEYKVLHTGNTGVQDNLIVNGNGALKNTNFTHLTWSAEDTNGCPGCFTYTGKAISMVAIANEYIPVDTDATYYLSYYIKDTNATQKFYDFLTMYDIDKKEIYTETCSFVAGSTTTLAKELKNGDTVVYLTDISGFNSSVSSKSFKGLIFWNYTDSLGHTYEAETYSRNVYIGLWDTANFDTTNNTITLSSGINLSATIPAGTAVSQSGISGVSLYPYYNSYYALATANTWYKKEGHWGGVGSNGAALGKFRAGTAYVRLGMLIHYNSSVSSTMRIANIRLVKESYLKTTGGTITGNIAYKGKYTSERYPFHVYGEETNGYGLKVSVGAGDTTIIGAGESAQNLQDSLSGENLYLTSDGNITFYAGCDTVANRVGMVFNNSRQLYPINNGTGSLGTSTNYWNTAYINTIHGAVDSLTSAPAVAWANGTTAGPTLAITAGGKTSAAVAIPSASSTTSGIINTTEQSFSGTKTFDNIKIKNNCSITLEAKGTIIQNQNTTSNYTSAIEWYKGGASQATYSPQVGQHNIGGTDSAGSITILPYATETVPWGGSVGLFITKNEMKLDGVKVLTAGNYNSYALPLDGGTLTGSLLLHNTQSKPFIIRRYASDMEQISHSLTDVSYSITYTNDEEASEIDFNFINTDTESNSGNSNTSIIKFIANSTGSTIQATTFSGGVAATTFNYSGIKAATQNNIARPVWFASSDGNGQPVYYNDFKYNPSSNNLTVGKVNDVIVAKHRGSLASGGWKALGGRTSGAKLTVAYNNAKAAWNSNICSSSLLFGANDTKGLLDIAYANPIVTFGGGDVSGSTDDAPRWYFKLTGTSAKTYNLDNFSKAPVITITGGTTGGPTISVNAGNQDSTAVAIPVASATASGVVSTTTQTFAGEKTFNDSVHTEDVSVGGTSATIKYNSTTKSLEFVFE